MDEAFQLEQRQNLIRKIANTYIYDYVQGMLLERFEDSQLEQKNSNDWLMKEISTHHISMEEFKKAIDEIEYKAKTENTICVYPHNLFSTKFFKGA